MKRMTALLCSAILLCVGLAIPIDFGDQDAAAFADSQLIAAQSNETVSYDNDWVLFKNGTEFYVAKGKTKKLKLNQAKNIKWTSSDKRIARVDKKGVVKGVRNGEVTITATHTTTGSYAECTVKVYKKTTKAKAHKAIVALKKKYREGRSWTNSNYYFWECENMHAYGCYSFAAICSDAAFGKYAPVKQHQSFGRIKPGDVVGIGDYHAVVVLKRGSGSIVVAEGNYNNSVHWGRKITKKELMSSGFTVYTRY